MFLLIKNFLTVFMIVVIILPTFSSFAAIGNTNMLVNDGILSANITSSSDWGSGYCRNIDILNSGSSALSWMISFDLNAPMTSAWNGKFSQSGMRYSVIPESWNQSVNPGTKISLGFCANSTERDSNWIIQQKTISISSPASIPGNCGTDNGKILSTIPTNLCITGTPSNVAGQGPWDWTCQGQNGGINMSCRSDKDTVVVLPTTSTTTASGILIFTVDANKNRTPISPYIYGRNFGEGNAENLAAIRLGGNRLTGYNWENNASNAGSDWNESSDSYLGATNVPGQTFTDFHDKNQAMGAPYSLVTLQMAGYVARDKNGSVGSNEVAPSSRWDDVIFAKNSPFSLIPNLTDGHVYMDELVNFLVQKYGKASSSTGIKGYSLDNEPALWPTTHPLLHPTKPTIKEMIDKSITLATAVKNVDNSAEIFGPVTYGFAENYHFQDATDWNSYSSYETYLDAYLANMKQASDTTKQRLLDVLDIHWYPEIQGTTAAGGKIRITDDNADPGVASARMQAPRALWDPTYTEDSWIGQWFSATALPLIPKLQGTIDKNYPGTKLAITEFDYGGRNHISGGIATADVLGVFGKYGVYFSSYWGDISGYVSSAYKLYRNYDGVKSTFGNTEISATNPDSKNISIYASDDGIGGKTHIILINKKGENIVTQINLAHMKNGQAEIYGFDSTDKNIRKFGTTTIANNSLKYTIPGTSAVHIILSSENSTHITDTIPGNNIGNTSVPISPPVSTPLSGGSSSVITPSVQTNTTMPIVINRNPTTESGENPIQITVSSEDTGIVFIDIQDSFAKDDIQWLAHSGVINGYLDHTFRPNKPITRAEFLKIILKGLNVPISSSIIHSMFKDVSTSWQIPIIAKAAQLGIINSNTTLFRPNDFITRAEAMKILIKSANIPSILGNSQFLDITTGYIWVIPFINAASELHIIQGQNGYFRPGDHITRAETAKIVYLTQSLK